MQTPFANTLTPQWTTFSDPPGKDNSLPHIVANCASISRKATVTLAMAIIARQGASPRTTAWPAASTPDPTPIVPSPITNFQQFPTMGSTVNGAGSSVTVGKAPTADQGAIIALAIICSLLILVNVFFVLLYCISRRLAEDDDVLTEPDSPRKHRSTKRHRRAYSESSMIGNDGFTDGKDSDLESLVGAGNKGQRFAKPPPFYPTGSANINPISPAYFSGERQGAPARPQMVRTAKQDASVNEPSDASVAGSSKYDEVHHLQRGRSLGSRHSSKSSRTETHGRPRGGYRRSVT